MLKQFNLRIEEDLKHKLEQIAKSNKRSTTNQINLILQTFADSYKPAAKKDILLS